MKNKDEVFNKFKEFKSLIENHIEKKRSRSFDEIMVENSLRMNSKSYLKTQGIRGGCTLLIIQNIMGLLYGRTKLP